MYYEDVTPKCVIFVRPNEQYREIDVTNNIRTYVAY